MRTGLLNALALLLLLVVGGATASADVLVDPPVSFSVEAATSGAEPATAVAFTIKLSAPADSTVSVRYSTAPAGDADAATADADYVPVKDVLVQVAKGHTAAKVQVRVLDDQLDEWPEKLLVSLSDPSDGTRISTQSATGSIQDNDEPPAAKVASPPDVPEGNSTAKAVFNVSLSRRSGRDVRVAFTTRDGTAKAGEDYVARSGVLRIPAGDLSGNVSVDVVGDTKKESTEAFTLAIARQDETAVMGTPTEAGVKILDDDLGANPPPPPPPPGPVAANLSIADGTGEESGTVTFRVTLAPAVTRAVTVKWATADGTATAGRDYAAGSGTLSFAQGETAKTVPITLLADEQAEANETFVINLSGAVGATVADAQAVGTIVEKQAATAPPHCRSVTWSRARAKARRSMSS